jgi:replicative DNA helicase
MSNERQLISGLLQKPGEILNCRCVEHDFVDQECRAIYIALSTLKDVSIPAIAKKSGVPVARLVELSDYAIPSGIPVTAKLVASDAAKQRIRAGAQRIIKEVEFTEKNELLASLLDLYRSENSFTDKDYSVGAVLTRFSQVQAANVKRGSLGISTRFNFLDSSNIQLVPGHMWVIGSLPGIGKSNILVQMLGNLDCRCLVFSTEMTEEQVVARYLANRTGIDAKVILSGCMIEKHKALAEKEKAVFAKKNIVIIDDVKQVEDIDRITRLESMKSGVDVIFIDYLQHLKIHGKRSKYEATADISHTIQDLAKSCRCTAVCFSQVTLSSHKEYTGNAQFKGAGEFAEDCDLGVRLMAGSKYPGMLKWITEKNRHGSRPVQILQYKDGYTKLEEIDHVDNQ